MSLAALPPCPLCLYWSVCPALPQPSLLSASALSPALSTLSSRPWHAWARPVCQLCSDVPDSSAAEGCWPCLAQLPLWPTQPWHTLGTPARGSQGLGWARPPYPWSLVPVHLQQRHSRPTTRSSKSTRPPPHPAQPPAPEVSAGPARSASPARCQAWPRATRHPASPRVSAAAPVRARGLCPVAAIVNQGHYAPQRTVGDY